MKPSRRLNFTNGEFGHFAQTANDIKPEIVPAGQKFQRPDHSNMMMKAAPTNVQGHDLTTVIGQETINGKRTN